MVPAPRQGWARFARGRPAAYHRRVAALPALSSLADRHARPLLAALIVALVALAWHNRFIQDDAFIAFRYARNLVDGHGPVFNPGERVEGYTCFLWVMMIAAAMRLGVDPITTSHAFGIAAFIGTLAATFSLARRLTGERPVAFLAVTLLGLCYSFSAYATGGLETQLQACLVLWFLAIGAGELEREAPRAAWLAIASTLAALAMMTRMDSVLLLTPMGVALAWRIVTRAPSGAARVAGIAALILPALLIVGGWLVWKMDYYGSPLPNTFHAKTGGRIPFRRGFFYLSQFLTSNWLIGPVLVALWMIRDLLARRHAPILIAALGLWTGYLVLVGGDFMEFRMLVPALPILFTFLALTIVLAQRRARLGIPLAAVAILGSWHHATTYPWGTHEDRNESVYELNAHVVDPGEDWIGSGRALRRDLAGDTTVWIATTAAGAIPYESGLPTVDMLGLCDAWVARHGDHFTNRPGHKRIATLDYLIERGVHLVIAHPTPPRTPAGPVCIEDFQMPRYAAGRTSGQRYPPGLQVVEIPIRKELTMLAYYLTPHPRVEEAIRAKGWRLRPIERCFRGPDFLSGG